MQTLITEENNKTTNKKTKENKAKYLLEKYRVLLVLVLLSIIASFLSDAFFSVNNIMNVLRQVSIIAIVSSGMTLVILIAGIDLSVGAVLALAGAALAGVLTAGISLPIAIAVALLVGLVVGSINGLLVSKFALPSFIVTLATMTIARGLTLVYTKGYPLTVENSFLQTLGNGKVLGIPIPVYIMFIIYIFMHWLLKYTTFGRYIYAVGGNEETAKLSGINVKFIKVAVFAIAGFLASLAAIIYTSRLMSAQPTAGQGIELDAIAAVIIGGTSLAGGKGLILGTLIGALIMGVLDNILNLMNVSPFYQSIAKGIVILIAILLDSGFSKMKKK
ncbi:MAG: ribose ABC transporter permease [Solibacillus sp.]